jgi:hypothetical protein
VRLGFPLRWEGSGGESLAEGLTGGTRPAHGIHHTHVQAGG